MTVYTLMFSVISAVWDGDGIISSLFLCLSVLFDVAILGRECIDMVFGHVSPDGDGFGDGIGMPCNLFMGWSAGGMLYRIAYVF